MKASALVCMAVVAFGCGGLVACGETATGPKFAQVKAGEMPAGETWAGVYYNPVYGYLNMVEQDGNVVGRWKRTDGSHWGELSGAAGGNVLHFTWKEHEYGGIGPSSETHGSGVFVFKQGQSNIPELNGQYAVDDSDNVGDWHCVKQLNIKPNLSSINGNSPTTGGPATSDQWK